MNDTTGTLEEVLCGLDDGQCLCCWSGKILGSQYRSVRADMVRFMLYMRDGDKVLYRAIPPYRPVAVYVDSRDHSEQANRLVFDTAPLFCITAGTRKGRYARAEDLLDDERALRVNTPVVLELKEHLNAPTKYRTELEASTLALLSFCAGGGVVRKLDTPPIPAFKLMSKASSQKVFRRSGASDADAGDVQQVGAYTVRSADAWHGKGVLCVYPEELGHWFVLNQRVRAETPCCVLDLLE